MATLPLLAGFLDTPFEPSPYRPVSRLFWNEFYLAVDRIPEWDRCATAREIWGSSAVKAHAEVLRASDLVDYREVMALKRKVLEQLVQCFFDGDECARKDELAFYPKDHSSTFEYARFRAEAEESGIDWREWPLERMAAAGVSPQPSESGEVRPGPTSQRERYHLFCQWQMEGPLSTLATEAASVGLFLDLPVGVHPGGFDSWRWPELFVHDMSAGAPSDSFFSLGQHWDSPPLHPERTKKRGHQYFAACLRHHMRHAAICASIT